MTKAATARFWEDHNGAVLIKISAGQTLHHSQFSRTDEGWNRYSRSISFDGETVTLEWCSDGTDCDGRMTRGGTVCCSVENLARGYTDLELGVTFPDWQNGADYQRDHAAEAMGY